MIKQVSKLLCVCMCVCVCVCVCVIYIIICDSVVRQFGMLTHPHTLVCILKFMHASCPCSFIVFTGTSFKIVLRTFLIEL